MTKDRILAHREVFARFLKDRVTELRVAAEEKVEICDLALKALGTIPEAAATKPTTIRHNEDGTLDEVFAAKCSFHLEQMHNNFWWIGIDDGAHLHHIRLTSPGKIKAAVESEARTEPQLSTPSEEK